MDSVATRKQVGDRFVRGVGVEIGAGLTPVIHANMMRLMFLDKRDREAFKTLFGEYPAYDLCTWDDIAREYLDGVDFIAAHHVVEHIGEPISVLIEWIRRLRVDGVLYISIPAEINGCESERIPTPARHVLEDFLFERSDDSYESKQHIYSFIMQWSIIDPSVRPWYAKSTPQELASTALREVKKGGHDLHWHTYSLDAIRGVVEAAFYFAGFAGDCIWSSTENDHSHYVAFRKTQGSRRPACVQQLFADLLRIVQRIETLG